jgi:NAD-dependent deacetylase
MKKSATHLAEAVTSAAGGLLLVVTGAGISRASGIPTFRGAETDAVWKVSDVELATWDYFQRDPVGQWHWYLKRFQAVDGARPNPAHQALAEIERWQTERGGRFLLVTQNIDTLHEAAGTTNLIKVHGTSDRLRCTSGGCLFAAPKGSLPRAEVDLSAFAAKPEVETLPKCPECGGLLRAHVLFFDEYYQEHRDYRFDEVLEAGEESSVFLFVGTSFSVGITDILLQSAALRRAPAFSIDPAGAALPTHFRVTQIEASAEEFLPQLMARLED